MDHCEQNVELKDVTPNVVTKKSRGRPKKNPDINIHITDKESKKEYNKLWYEQNKEKTIQTSKERYYQNTDEAKNQNLKLQKRYRDGYKLLKELLTQDKLPTEYVNKVKAIIA